MPLREIRENDLELMLSWRNHPAVRTKMFSQSVIELEEHKAWFKRVSMENDSLWLLYLEAEGIPRGIVYFTNVDRSTRHAFWGFYAAPDAPPGTGTKMGNEALDFFFNRLGFHKLNADVLESNERSHFFHSKLGFQVESIFYNHYLGSEGYESVTRFALIKDDGVSG